ncbi:hypothetical protein HK102_005116 [Quaeritorhiza haematococci]|nr:hypothetical protein HK102_005116 [Quaeritorhiza haematococci]
MSAPFFKVLGNGNTNSLSGTGLQRQNSLEKISSAGGIFLPNPTNTTAAAATSVIGPTSMAALSTTNTASAGTMVATATDILKRSWSSQSIIKGGEREKEKEKGSGLNSSNSNTHLILASAAYSEDELAQDKENQAQSMQRQGSNEAVGVGSAGKTTKSQKRLSGWGSNVAAVIKTSAELLLQPSPPHSRRSTPPRSRTTSVSSQQPPQIDLQQLTSEPQTQLKSEKSNAASLSRTSSENAVEKSGLSDQAVPNTTLRDAIPKSSNILEKIASIRLTPNLSLPSHPTDGKALPKNSSNENLASKITHDASSISGSGNAAATTTVAIEASELSRFLRDRDARREGVQQDDELPVNPNAMLNQNTDLLLVDVRLVTDFMVSHVAGSINVNLPPIILRRFRKGSTVSTSFQLESFVTEPKFKQVVEQWKKQQDVLQGGSILSSRRRCILVYDDQMAETETDSQAWAVVALLNSSKSASASSEGLDRIVPDTIVAYLKGGYRGFVQHIEAIQDQQATSKFIESDDEENQTQNEAPMSLQMQMAQEFSDDLATTTTSCFPQLPQDRSTPGQPYPQSPLVRTEGAPPQRKQSVFSIKTSNITKAVKRRHTSTDANRGGGGGMRLGLSLNTTTLATPPSLETPLTSKAATTTKIGMPPPSALPKLGDWRSGLHGSGGERWKKTIVEDEICESPSVAVPPETEISGGSSNVDEAGMNSEADDTHALPDVYGELILGEDQQIASPETSPLTESVDSTTPYSCIMPYLFLGSDATPTSPTAIEEMKALGVTHILNMAAEVNYEARFSTCKDFVIKRLPIEDNSEIENLDLVLHEGIAFIAAAHASSPNAVVFVHCKAGKSRSAMVVLGYLMQHEHMSLQNAYNHVKKQRPDISPNIGFMLALMRFERDISGGSACGDQQVKEKEDAKIIL